MARFHCHCRTLFAMALLGWGGCQGKASTPTGGDVAAAVDRPGDAAPSLQGDPAAASGYLKGSTHVHSARSGDSHTGVDRVIQWYVEHDYDFIVVTDHNRVTLAAEHRDLIVIPGVELTHNARRCWPPPEPDGQCRIHVNSLFATPEAENERAARAGQHAGDYISWREPGLMRRVDIYERALAVNDDLGGIAQLNHPTWHWGVSGELLVDLGRRGVVLVEIANQAFASWNRGDDTHASAEALWDHALSGGVVLWGVASDDAHHYYEVSLRERSGSPSYAAGTGFVMVRARRDKAAIRAALRSGDFYSSTGILLEEVGKTDHTLTVSVAGGGDHNITFIGTRGGDGGQILATHRGRHAAFTLRRPGYVRAVVSDDHGRKAWTQPLFVQ